MAHNENAAQGAARSVVVDAVVAVLIFALGALVAYDSQRLGASWASDGPQAASHARSTALALRRESFQPGPSSTNSRARTRCSSSFAARWR